MPTWKCPAECTHCGTLSSPREKTRLPLVDIISCIDQAAENGYKVVFFTGGEPTLAGKNLISAIERASTKGLFTRIVSNAYWAINDKTAKKLISDLVRAGLTEINFSTGDQHARFVDIENVIRATRAAVYAGLRVSIMIETVNERKITKEFLESHPKFKQVRKEFPNSWININESPWMPLSSSVIAKYNDGMLTNSSNVNTTKGCDNVLKTTTIEADGTIAACCGIGMRIIPELHLGNIHDTKLEDADKKAADDFLKHWIRVEGPERILAWASKYNPEIDWENMYAHRCQACIRLYTDPKVKKVIFEHYREKIADVVSVEWLLYHFKPDLQTNRDGSKTNPSQFSLK